MNQLNKIFNNGVQPRTDSGIQSHRAQLFWSLCVAIAVAVVALQQVVGTRHQPLQRSTAAVTVSPAPQAAMVIPNPVFPSFHESTLQ